MLSLSGMFLFNQFTNVKKFLQFSGVVIAGFFFSFFLNDIFPKSIVFSWEKHDNVNSIGKCKNERQYKKDRQVRMRSQNSLSSQMCEFKTHVVQSFPQKFKSGLLFC